MSQKYHVNPETHESGPCGATHGKCPFEHYDTAEEAQQAAVEMSESSPDAKVAPIRKKKPQFLEGSGDERDGGDDGYVEMSFLEGFRETQRQFQQDFDGVPSSFYSKKVVFFNPDDYDPEATPRDKASLSRGSDEALAAAIYPSLTSSEDNAIDHRFIESTMSHYGAESLSVVSSSNQKSLKPGYLLRVPVDGGDKEKYANIYVTAHGSKKLKASLVRSSVNLSTDDDEPASVSRGEVMIVVGAKEYIADSRLKTLTGESLIDVVREKDAPTKKTSSASINSVAEEKQRVESLKARVVDMQYALYERQQEGENFLAQQSYIRRSSSKVATAFDEKKNVDKTHREMAERSPLRQRFAHIEIDNDVAPQQWESFEQSFQEIQDKLPPAPDGVKPTLRIRKLGKHNMKDSYVDGIYNPSNNTIALDVHTSGSYVHEQMHQYDVAVTNNASLSQQFRPVVSRYRKMLDEQGVTGKQKAYLATPSEVFARLGEQYSHEKLGIKNNRLLDETALQRNEYDPFKNPEMKKMGYEFMDNVFKDIRNRS